MKASNPSYHHGDLRSSLISTATSMIHQGGIEALSLRKLAENIGVSRTAAYHHFKDKNDLLSAIAAQGFRLWQQQAEITFAKQSLSSKEKYQEFVHNYVHFAYEKPALYQLMFGSTLWKNNQSSPELKSVAYPSFQYQVKLVKTLQSKSLLPQSEPALRLAQVTWATLHGIAQLVIDGIYADATHIDDMCQCAVNLFLSQESPTIAQRQGPINQP